MYLKEALFDKTKSDLLIDSIIEYCLKELEYNPYWGEQN